MSVQVRQYFGTKYSSLHLLHHGHPFPRAHFRPMPTSHPSVRAAVRFAVVLLFALSAAPRLRAQDTLATRNLKPTPDSQYVKLTLVDGSVLVGQVREVTATTVRFASVLGESVSPRSAIRRVEATSSGSVHDGEVWPEDPSRTRLFFAPTGRMQHAGEVYFSDAYVLFPSFQGGLSDRLSVGAGMSVVPGLGLDEQVYYITPKVGLYASPNVNLAIGALVAGAGAITDEGPFGLGYGVATVGGEDGSVTVGAGFGFHQSSTSQAIFMLGGSKRVSSNIALLTENYLYTEHETSALISAGIRFMSEKLAVDLAGFTVSDSGVPIIPYVAFIYRF
jgi:hypothetical protein